MSIPEFGTVKWFDLCACVYLVICSLPFDGAMWCAPMVILCGIFSWALELLQDRPLVVYVQFLEPRAFQ